MNRELTMAQQKSIKIHLDGCLEQERSVDFIEEHFEQFSL